jgi:hypothetical protein
MSIPRGKQRPSAPDKEQRVETDIQHYAVVRRDEEQRSSWPDEMSRS